MTLKIDKNFNLYGSGHIAAVRMSVLIVGGVVFLAFALPFLN